MTSTEVWVNSRTSVKFPFEPYECQKVFMKNVISALDSKMDAALESPTGTGKTLSLLCATLAWVQKQKETKTIDLSMIQSIGDPRSSEGLEKLKNSFIPTIYYASRTHSQLEQVVSELNRTEYKWVKTTILGSREHFCINPKVKKIQQSNKQSHVCRGMVSKRSCHYFNTFDRASDEKIAEVMDKGEAMDIEDIVKAGQTHSMCPYFMSRKRSESAELVLLPYNYVIDPKMRRRYKLELKNSIVIFDEAHNLESICESNASAEITSTIIATCIEELKKVLALVVEEHEQARLEGDTTTEAFGSNKVDLTKKLIDNIKTEEVMAVLEKMFKMEEEFETLWKSENMANIDIIKGKTANGEVLLEIFDKVGFNSTTIDRVVDLLRDATSYLLQKGEEMPLIEKGDAMENVCDFLLSIFSTHAQEVAANVGEADMKLVDKVDPKIVAKNCKLFMKREEKGTLHIKYFCFQASISMRMLKMRGVRNVLLASGTLSPIQSFTLNMGLNFGAVLENEHALKSVPVLTSVVTKGYRGVITGSYANRSNTNYVIDVGEALVRVLDETPQGVLVFFASYTQMNDLISSWKMVKRSNNTETLWSRMQKAKEIVIEPKAKEELVICRTKYVAGVREANGAALFAVCRGKVSEGIDFCDAESRAVVVIGVPYPPVNDERVVLKRMFLDGIRLNKKGSQAQSSNDWYQMEAFRAVNQAIGRVLRHKDDFGVVVLLDSRYGTAKLEMFPKWLRNTIQRGDANDCAAKIQRFFGERSHLVQVSRKKYIDKKTIKCSKVKSASSSSGTQNLTKISLDELFATDDSETKIEEIGEQCCSSSTSGFFLPTDEVEINLKMERDRHELMPRSNKRAAPVQSPENLSAIKRPPMKKKMVLVKKEDRFENGLKLTTAQIIGKLKKDEDRKSFAIALKSYKTGETSVNDVFDKFTSIFLPTNVDCFIGCANLLKPDDKMKYIQLCKEKRL